MLLSFLRPIFIFFNTAWHADFEIWILNETEHCRSIFILCSSLMTPVTLMRWNAAIPTAGIISSRGRRSWWWLLRWWRIHLRAAPIWWLVGTDFQKSNTWRKENVRSITAHIIAMHKFMSVHFMETLRIRYDTYYPIGIPPWNAFAPIIPIEPYDAPP